MTAESRNLPQAAEPAADQASWLRVTKKRLATVLVVIVAISVGQGCSSKEKPAPESAAGAVAMAPGANPRASAGPAASMACVSTMDSLHTQTWSSMRLTDAQLSVMLPTHRRQVTAMLTNMNSHMHSMGIAASPAFAATADSVRADLDRFDTMSPGDVRRAMPAHEARLSRLMQLYMTSCRQHMS